MIVRTETGSIYEIDFDNKNIRRLSGVKDPTLRIGKDGNWKSYASVSPPEIGHPLIIIWDGSIPPLDGSQDPCLKTTMTSYITEIEPEITFN